MSNELLDIIRIANRELQEFINHVSRDGAKGMELRKAIRRLPKVGLRLNQVSERLAAEPAASARAPEVAHEMLKYQENLKALRHALETVQFSLLAEKSYLENARANLQAARAWATSLREIS